MSKNTSSSAFRKIDIDQYSEDIYKEEEGSEAQSPPAGPDETEITNLLKQGKTLDALLTVLRTAPVGSKNVTVRDSAYSLVIKVLMSIKTCEMEKAVTSLDRDLLDVLMKYIYRGFEYRGTEYPSEKCSAHLLAWHEKAYAVGGVGSIVRVLTDKKRV